MRIEFYTNQPYNQQQNKSAHSDIALKSALPAEIKFEPQKLNTRSAITTAAISAVCGAFILSRGFQKNASKFLNKVKVYFEGKRELSSIKDSGTKVKFYDFAIKRINSFIKKSESINNITSLKDILFMKLMYKTKPTKRIHELITNYFEKISYNTVKDSYKKTEKHLGEMNRVFDNLDEIILKDSPDEIIKYGEKEYTKKQLIKKAKEYRDNATTIVNSCMSKIGMEYRYNYIQKVTSGLYKTFWDASFKDFWSKNNKFKRKEMWQTFIAAEQIKGDKTALAAGISKAREALSYTSTDRNEMIKEYISKLDGFVPPDDAVGINIIKRLEWFMNHPDELQNKKDIFIEELEKLKKHEVHIPDKNLEKTHKECKESYISIVEEYVLNPPKGEIQDMLSIYYALAPSKLEKLEGVQAVKKLVKSFNKSVDLECVEYFDKKRDLVLGSAPTDVLTILFSFITLSAGLGYTKDWDKKKSIMLKSGIPIVGGIAATIVTATKLVSGGKSLVFGFLSGIILNQFGKIADNVRKNYNMKTYLAKNHIS